MTITRCKQLSESTQARAHSRTQSARSCRELAWDTGAHCTPGALHGALRGQPRADVHDTRRVSYATSTEFETFSGAVPHSLDCRSVDAHVLLNTHALLVATATRGADMLANKSLSDGSDGTDDSVSPSSIDRSRSTARDASAAGDALLRNFAKWQS